MGYFPPSQFRDKSPEVNVLTMYTAVESLVENNSICQKLAQLKHPSSYDEE